MRGFERRRRGHRLFTTIASLLLVSALQTSVAQEAIDIESINLLKPSNTASPRDTLRSFLFYSDASNRARAQRGPMEARTLFFRGTAETIDFESTVYGRSISEQVRRILWLKEVLDRIRLPPIESVPDFAAVAAADLQHLRWEIPGTDIAIAESLDPALSGTFLFDPQTVADIRTAYERVRHLPYSTARLSAAVEYRSAATSPDFYERYVSTPGHLVPRYVLVSIREMLHAHPKIDRDTVRVRFYGYGASSLDISMRIYAWTREWNEYYAIREDVFLRIKSIVRESGTSFAFPSQTLYMTRDSGLDTEVSNEAVAQVESWREAQDLPFPSLRDARMDELEGTLDYPPRGSPQAKERLSTPGRVDEAGESKGSSQPD